MNRRPNTPQAGAATKGDRTSGSNGAGAKGGKGSTDLKMLAEHLGLSKGTISRALNGYPEIAEATRERVLAAADALGYRPNRAARRLATGRNDLISYIGTGSDWMSIDRAFLSALSSTLSDQGYGLMVSLADSVESAEEVMERLLEEKRVDGFIFNSLHPNDPRLDLVEANQIPVALVGASHAEGRARTEPVPTISLADSAVLDGLVDYLNSLGHEHIGYFGCDAPEVLQRQHSLTLAASSGNRGIAFTPSTCVPAEQLGLPGHERQTESASVLSDRATALLERKPTAVFCGCERTVVALYMAARDAGMSVPSELSIIGIGSSQLASWLSGGLSTVTWSLGEAGRLAADCIVSQIEGRATAEILSAGIEAQFVARSSHGPAPRALG